MLIFQQDVPVRYRPLHHWMYVLVMMNLVISVLTLYGIGFLVYLEYHHKRQLKVRLQDGLHLEILVNRMQLI